jgi:hypothetical protein
MNKNTLVAIIAGLVVVCVTALGIAFIVSGGTEDEPAPTPTVSAPVPTPSDTSDPILDILEDTWNQTPSGQQESLCLYFNVDPEGAFDAFNEGSQGLVPQDTFNSFFSEKCSTST